jgi:hypothetical protein
LTELNPAKRITPEQALNMPFFTESESKETNTPQVVHSEPLHTQTSFEPSSTRSSNTPDVNQGGRTALRPIKRGNLYKEIHGINVPT